MICGEGMGAGDVRFLRVWIEAIEAGKNCDIAFMNRLNMVFRWVGSQLVAEREKHLFVGHLSLDVKFGKFDSLSCYQKISRCEKIVVRMRWNIENIIERVCMISCSRYLWQIRLSVYRHLSRRSTVRRSNQGCLKNSHNHEILYNTATITLESHSKGLRLSHSNLYTCQ